MSRTITAMFNDRSEAEQAAAQLRTQIGAEPQIIDQSGSETSSTESTGGFWQGLKDMFVAHDDRPTYEEGVRRGHFLLCAKIPEDQADRACSLIEHAGAMDLEENEQKWRTEGWSGSPGGFASGQTQGYASETDTQTQGFSTEPQSFGESRNENVVDEGQIRPGDEWRVGRRETERGGSRVRSYVEEGSSSGQVNPRQDRSAMFNEDREVSSERTPDFDPAHNR